MDLLQRANDWVQKGYQIKYLILNQFENGYGKEVIAGDMPHFTYSFVIDKDDEELWDYSVDSLEEGYSMAIEWLENNIN
ncbi:hypothetical protein ACIQZG_20770 [Lysinibacillus sp. NPDC096418]|uniref:hypothetical protein n=1 Tax=Lysinibacillus sp. NPDC096418 TaxID=3364138 RepID=UPI0038103D83